MPGLQHLAQLIAAENPYSNGNVDDMDIYLLAQSTNNNPNVIGTPNAGNPIDLITQSLSQIDFEMTNYGGTWDFKSVPQPISRALRIKYRYRVPNPGFDPLDPGNTGVDSARWRTDYLLIGFVNGGAG
jgi:hypothetical protein